MSNTTFVLLLQVTPPPLPDMMSVLPFLCVCTAAAAILVYRDGTFLRHHPFPIIFFLSFFPSAGRPTTKGREVEVGAAAHQIFAHTPLFQNTHTKGTPANNEEKGIGLMTSFLGILA